MSLSRWIAGLLALTFGLAVPGARADVVVRHDGSEVEGTVVSVNEESVVLRNGRGERLRIGRDEVAAIRFDRKAPPVRVELRNIESDDALDIFLDGAPVLTEGRRGGEWIDLTPSLKDGNNPLTLRIHNARGSWAYRIALRLNGETRILSCGTPHRGDDPCRDHGHSGLESGVIEDLPPVWIHVDFATGRAEVLP